MTDVKSEGFSRSKIKGKLSCIFMQNAYMKLENVFVPEENRLSKASDFR